MDRESVHNAKIYESVQLYFTLEILLISKSKSPILVLGYEVFITARVAAPVYNTKATTDPCEATMQFIQRALSKVQESNKELLFHETLPSNLYISL
jgi:hypothetical protein